MRNRDRMVMFVGNKGKQFISQKFNRNAKCVCGSGKKQKHCCGSETKLYLPRDKEKKQDETAN